MTLFEFSTGTKIEPLNQVYELKGGVKYICFAPRRYTDAIIQFCDRSEDNNLPDITFIFVPDDQEPKELTINQGSSGVIENITLPNFLKGL